MSGALCLFEPAPAAPLLELRCCDVAELLAELPRRGIAPSLVVADPPWPYDQRPGVAAPDLQYATLDLYSIVGHLAASYAVAARDARLVVWATGPWLGPLLVAMAASSWRYVTAGAWVKTDGCGVGYHWRGRAEIAVVFAKGSPFIDRSAHLRSGYASGELSHSEKPTPWMAGWLGRWVPPGGAVLDLYAGETASLARACRARGVAYLGAEIDPLRHAAALQRQAAAGITGGEEVAASSPPSTRRERCPCQKTSSPPSAP